MKLLEALNIIQKSAASTAEPFRVALVCGFTPLDVQTFLHAELQAALPARRVEVEIGHFGDVAGTLRSLEGKPLHAIALVLEWSDLDARLGTRQLGGWGPANLNDVVEHARNWLAHIAQLLENFSCPVAVSLPTLPLPPLFHTAGWQFSPHEMALRSAVTSFAESLSRNARIRVINPQRLDERSPMAARLDVKSEWKTGFPYSSVHAGAVANVLSPAILNAPPKKGLITDLDNTLWRGIVGDAGVEDIWWDLDHNAQQHGVYQQMLSTLAQEGVLVAIASKNDPGIVERAFERRDILISKDRIFPFDVSWGSKAHAVSRILAAWNIGAGDVVFVDDNPAELAEVEAAHPGITGMLFPDGSPKQVYELCVRLRDLFGKPGVSAEDEIRLESLRAGAAMKASGDNSEGFSEALLEHAQAELTLSFRKDPQDARTFELINKTNQFNLNGKRIQEAEWAEWLKRDDTFVLTVSYKDRFGSLGKIAVLSGCKKASHTCVHHWVMSCRAFARRIEHQCVKALFDHLGTDSLVFDYAQTERNGPLTKVLTELGAGKAPQANFSLQADAFQAACPRLFHQVQTES